MRSSLLCALALAACTSTTAPVMIEPDAGGDPTPHKLDIRAGSASLSSWDFGAVEMGTSSTILALTITNDTLEVTGALDVHFEGADPGQFAIDTQTTCVIAGSGIELAPSAACDLFLHFAPSDIGARSASLVVSATPGGAVSLAVSGTGAAAPDLATSPPFVDFGVIEFGQPAGQTFQVNNGGADVTIASVAINQSAGTGVSITSTTCAGTLAQGATCDVAITFAPTAYGQNSADLVIVTDLGTYTQGTNWVLGYGGVRITVAKQGAGAGTVISDGGGVPDINCDPDCSGIFMTAGQHILTESTAGAFGGWGAVGCGSGETCTIDLNTTQSPVVVTATFN